MFLDVQIQFLILLQNMRAATGNIFDTFFLEITKLGAWGTALFIAAFVYWCVCEKKGSYILFLIVFGTIANQAIKVAACVYRPWIIDSAVIPVSAAVSSAGGYSFPSGHTATVTAVWGGIAYLWRRNTPIFAGALAIVVLVIFSRLYLGVHTPQDVLVSAAVGLILIFAVQKILAWVDGGFGRDNKILAFVFAVIVLLMLYATFKSYPMDYVAGKLLVDPTAMKNNTYGNIGVALGTVLGWYANRRLLDFKASDGTWGIKAARYIVGASILWLTFNFTKPFFVGTFGASIGGFLFFFIIAAYIAFLYPAACILFKKVITARR